MARDGTIAVKVVGDATQLNRTLADTERKVGGFGRTLAGIGTAIGGAFAAKKVFDFAGGAIKAAQDARRVAAQTAAVIRSTGGAANVSAKQIDKLTGVLMRKIAVDDDEIKANANLLLTFTKVRNEVGKGNNIFDQAVEVFEDMKAAVPSASMTALGKALNDPLKGITALTRMGVTFDAQQRKQIETMVRVGNVAGAQKLILAELRTEYAGSAAAQADAGDRLRVTWGEIQEQVGGVLLPVLDKVAKAFSVVLPKAIDVTGRAFGKVKGFLEDNVGSIDDFQTGLTLLRGELDEQGWTENNFRTGLTLVKTELDARGVTVDNFRRGLQRLGVEEGTFTWDNFVRGLNELGRTFRTLQDGWDQHVVPVLAAVQRLPRTVANGVLSFVETNINAAINTLNAALDAIDRAAGPLLNLPDIGKISIPRIGDTGSNLAIGDTSRTATQIIGTNTGPTGAAPTGRAVGGPVLAGRNYLIGERGPELLRMGTTSGYVHPNRELAAATRKAVGAGRQVPVFAEGAIRIQVTGDPDAMTLVRLRNMVEDMLRSAVSQDRVQKLVG